MTDSATHIQTTEPEPSIAAPDGHPVTNADPLLVTNLLGDLDAIADLLEAEIGRGSWLNAYLLAAGLNQILEDHLHDNPISLARVARHWQRVAPRPFGAAGAAAVRAADAVIWQARQLPRGERQAAAWQRRLAGLVDLLADAVVRPPAPGVRHALATDWATLRHEQVQLSMQVRRSIVRLPSCFRSFDQRPADIERLTVQFGRSWPDRQRAIAVVGVRTSGCYTAPLHGAWLRALGYERVRVLTVRPGRRWRRDEADVLAEVVRSAGLALVTDDPPKSGGSVAKTVLELERLGFGATSIVLLLQTLAGTDRLPDRLRKYPAVVLPWPDWSVQALLQPDAVRITLAGMFGPHIEVQAVDCEPLAPARSARGHVHARFRAHLRDRSSGETRERDIHVKGVGLGYFGEHALAVARPLQAFLPEVIGLKDGLLYRSWLPHESRLTSAGILDAGSSARAAVDYAVKRARALPVGEDVSLRLVDRGAVWQRAADIMTRGFGRAAQLTRPLSHPLAKGLLRVPKPSVIDGSMELDAWFAGAPTPDLRKIDFDERAFSSLDVYCNDHLFDVAGWAPVTSDTRMAATVRRAYREQTGRTIDPERWLLYRLVHLAERGRDLPQPDIEVERAMAREMQQYYLETVFADLTADPTGPLCAFDVDWSLETRNLGFPAITPRSAYALHALARHGYRVAIATGRSVQEVRERCRAFRLIGGVAEYGAASYDARADRVTDLRSPVDREDLDRVRGVLSEREGIELDREYAFSVRAYQLDAAGRRRGVADETIASVLALSGLRDRVRAIKGAHQTDFMVRGIDKGVGLRVLASGLGVSQDGAGKALALAVGDSGEDLPMLEMARLAMAPSNADSAVRTRGVRILSAPDQLGLARAVARLIGHAPGACPTCRANHLPPRTQLLLTALGAQDARGLSKIFQAYRLARSLAGTPL